MPSHSPCQPSRRLARAVPRHLLVVLLMAAMPAWAHAANAGSSIPGVYAIDGTLNVIGTQASHNTCSVTMDSTGEWDIVTLNGHTVEYPSAEVSVISYYGGLQGSDTLTLGATYAYQDAFAYLYGGHNTATVSAHECEALIYGDYNAISTTTGAFAIAIGEEGAHNTYTGTGTEDSTAADVNVYASTLPGLYDQYGTVYIALDPTRANTVSVAPGSGGTRFTINGATDTIPATFTVGTLVFTSGLVNGDAITVTVPNITVKGWLFPDQEQVSMTGDVCGLTLLGTGDTIAATSGSSGAVNIDYDGATKPFETISSTLSITYSQGGPMVGAIPAGGSAGTGTSSGTASATATATATATGGGTGSVVASGSSGSSSGCGLGGSMAVLAGLALALKRRRRGMA